MSKNAVAFLDAKPLFYGHFRWFQRMIEEYPFRPCWDSS
jgi:hypothetical protein